MKKLNSYLQYLDEQVEIALAPIIIGSFVGAIIGQEIAKRQDRAMGACFDEVGKLIREKKISGFNNKRIAILDCRIKFCNNILKALKANRSKCNKSQYKEQCFEHADKEIIKFEKLLFRYNNAKRKIQTQRVALPRLI